MATGASRTMVAVLTIWLASAVSGTAQADDLSSTCAVPDSLLEPEFPLPHVSAKIKAGEPVPIVVIGSGSSAGMGASTLANAYPERLGVELGKRFPKTKFEMTNLSRRGQPAAEMAGRFASEVESHHPALVIWQTGTVDAVRAVDLAAFSETLESGIDELMQHEIDVILVDMQYSPHTSTALDVGPYRDYMRWSAQNRGVILFDRFTVMQYWSESGVIDFTDPAKAAEGKYDDIVHGCVAYLLASMIERAVAPELQPPPPQ